MRDDERTNKRQTVKIELLSQWKLEAEFRNFCVHQFLVPSIAVAAAYISIGHTLMVCNPIFC